VERRAGRGHPEDGGPGGYHHLGVATSAQWAGVTGRMTVRDAAVRAGSWDFLATRFMAKRHVAGGEVFWLEAGWAETGWSGDGRQRVYTYDTNGRAWRFYDDYALRDGQQIWIGLHSDGDIGLHSDGATGLHSDGDRWQAWLWWDDRWNLLSAQHLPTGRTAQIEQYVEVHVDRADPVPLSVPPVNLDNVQLRDPDRDRLRYWRAGQVATTPTRTTDDGYCLDWTTRYDTWSAGDCPEGPRQP
ncbi:MAG TPA: hypothetical protein VES42_00820, partial [Pilimelia sp.]|nr:hypothetical protein [Pilimelia sp.]